MRRPCVLFVSSRSGINPSAGVITNHSQSPVFEVPAPCGGPRPPKAGTHFTEWAE